MAQNGLIDGGAALEAGPGRAGDAVLIETPRYRARFASDAAEFARAEALRAAVFRGDPTAPDADAFDPVCRHLIVEDRATGTLAATCRIFDLDDGRRIGESYSAQVYGLARLESFEGRMAEIGRFCIAPETDGADVLRLAWAALTRIVAADGIEMLFGCSSFRGRDARRFRDAFALLGARHLAPPRWRPEVKAPEIVCFPVHAPQPPDMRRALKAMPPLLRTYLLMGGWVSDHAVRDRDLGTFHVFTGLEVGRVPRARADALRALAIGGVRPRGGA